jgi:hypothetical protein
MLTFSIFTGARYALLCKTQSGPASSDATNRLRHALSVDTFLNPA